MTDYLIRNGRAVLKICCVAVCALSFLIAAHAYAQPSTVFVWNLPPEKLLGSTGGDTFDFCAEGFIWQELGLLDENGKPGHVNPANDADIIDDAGNILGEVLKDANGLFMGYKNRDGTKEAYNVTRGRFRSPLSTVDHAWQRVAVNGELHIIKHGFWIDRNGNEINDPGEEGGGMQLDNGWGYGGFTRKDEPGPGTGSPFLRPDGELMPPYPLEPRPGANITLNVNACYSAEDPDEPDAPGGERSVTDTAKDVPGVSAVLGHRFLTFAGLNGRARLVLVGAGTPADVDAALTALEHAALDAGIFSFDLNGRPVGDLNNWIERLPFDLQYFRPQEIIDRTVGPGKVRLVLPGYWKTIGAPGCECPYHSHPVQCPVTGGGVQYSNKYSLAVFDIPPGALSHPRMLHARQIVDFSTIPLLSGAVLRSGVYDFRFPDYPTELATLGRITLRYLPKLTLDLYLPMDIYRFDTTTRSWKIDGDDFDKAIDPQTSLISTIAPEIGIYAAFSKLPKLDAAVMNSNIVISWLCPAGGSTGFSLQSSTSPVGPWVTDSGFTLTTFDVDGDGILDCIASAPIASGAKFYRLYLPVQ